jgi:hypothetical protein
MIRVSITEGQLPISVILSRDGTVALLTISKNMLSTRGPGHESPFVMSTCGCISNLSFLFYVIVAFWI